MNRNSTPVLSFFDGAAQAADHSSATLRIRPFGASDLELALQECGPALIDQAVRCARDTFARTRSDSVKRRHDRLLLIAQVLEAEQEALAVLISQDIGKPIRVARGEVARGVQFTLACAAAVTQMEGAVLPLDAAQAGSGRFGFVRRVPIGVVGAITPFNAPINLLLQKLAPALAAGNAVIAKPAPVATRVAIHLAQALHQAGLEAGLFGVLSGDRDAAAQLAAHPGVDVVSFTGGVEGGIALSRQVGVRKFVSELGSNAANVVLADADLESAAMKIAASAFEASGQQCISAQRVIVEAPVFDAFLDLFTAAADKLQVGPPDDPKTDIGPMVSDAAAARIASLHDDAVANGARAVRCYRAQGRLVQPVILADVPRTARVWLEEAFGPIALVVSAKNCEHALELANDSPFGLQGAVFTHDLRAAFAAAERFDVGALWVNEASRFRLDMYPFGGMKQSGIGREGVKYAIEELSQLKFIGINPG